MELYYINKKEFLEYIDKLSLDNFWDGREYACKEKYEEHILGLFLTKFIAKHIYGVKNLNIEYVKNKPKFMNGGISFSISHSKNIVLVAFNNANIGVDIEFMQERDYKKIMQRYKQDTENPTKEDFYRFWTLHEAEIKLGKQIRSLYSTFLEKEYMISCVSSDVLVTNLLIKKLICIGGNNINLLEEFQHPKNLKVVY